MCHHQAGGECEAQVNWASQVNDRHGANNSGWSFLVFSWEEPGFRTFLWDIDPSGASLSVTRALTWLETALSYFLPTSLWHWRIMSQRSVCQGKRNICIKRPDPDKVSENHEKLLPRAETYSVGGRTESTRGQISVGTVLNLCNPRNRETVHSLTRARTGRGV